MKFNELFKGKIQAGGRIVIDGREFKGNNISINGDKVIVDGVEQSGSLINDISIQIYGNVETLSTSSGDVYVDGNINKLSTTSGDVTAQDVGSISTTSGDIEVLGNITGNVRTVSGDIISR